METISKFITYAKAVYSYTAVLRGIKNVPGSRELRAMKILAEKIHTPISERFGFSIPFASFFRSNILNRIVGGSKTSQHIFGEAIDLDVDDIKGVTNKDVFYWILENLEFDQLIWEFGTANNPDWVHVSYTEKRPNRKQVLRAIRKNGSVIYVTFDLTT